MRLRPFQKTSLEAHLDPVHLICVAPTGSGKSLIYETAIRRNGWKTVLVSPLIALSKQIASRLREAGVEAFYGRAPKRNESGAWIISPEAVESDFNRGFARLRQWSPEFLVVDECHCIWDWGDTFRPAFARLPTLVQELALRRSLWLTATLPPAAREELRQLLFAAGGGSPVRELGEFALPENLVIRAPRVPWRSRLEALVSWVRSHPEPGIVFAPTREKADHLAELLRTATSRRAFSYHAGMSREERTVIEARLVSGQLDLVVATSAFGLGVHHPRLRWTLLWQAPPSLLSLAQFLGRAGRDPATASTGVIFWDAEDFRLLEWTLQGSEKRKEELLAVHRFLGSEECRRDALRRHFNSKSDPHPYTCTRCDNCFAVKIQAS